MGVQSELGEGGADLRHGMVFCAVSSLLALVFNRVNPILAQGAAFGAVTMVDRFDDGDVTDLICTGDRLRVDPAAGLVEIVNRERSSGE